MKLKQIPEKHFVIWVSLALLSRVVRLSVRLGGAWQRLRSEDRRGAAKNKTVLGECGQGYSSAAPLAVGACCVLEI